MDRLDPRLREELLALGPRRDYRAGQRLLMEGAATTHVFLIVTGVVKVTATAKERGPAVLAMRHEGDLVGELAAMDGSPRSASVVACRQVTAHEIGRAAFLAFRDRPGVSPVVSSTVNDRLLSEACRSAGIDRGHWHRQPQGDGEFALVPADVPKPLLVDDFVGHLVSGLRRYNRDQMPPTRMRLRVAMHHGEVRRGRMGYSGELPVLLSRLLGSDALREALNAVPAADLVLILSDRMYEDAVRDGYRRLVPESFRRVRVVSKNFDGHGWIHLPDHAPPSLPDPATPRPAPRPGGRTGRQHHHPPLRSH